MDNKNSHINEFTRILDKGINEEFREAGEYNCDRLVWVKEIENYFNLKLIECGKVYLNEVYEALGIPKTNAGSVVGWKYDSNRPSKDNIIDFGIEEDRNTGFINNCDVSALILNFNVDGVITD